MKQGLLALLPTMYGIITRESPPNLFFQSNCLGRVLYMSVNNTTLRWPMLDRGVDRIRLWYWMKVRYYSTAKLEPLNFFTGIRFGRLS